MVSLFFLDFVQKARISLMPNPNVNWQFNSKESKQKSKLPWLPRVRTVSSTLQSIWISFLPSELDTKRKGQKSWRSRRRSSATANSPTPCQGRWVSTPRGSQPTQWGRVWSWENFGNCCP
jgi:hypothetical protein